MSGGTSRWLSQTFTKHPMLYRLHILLGGDIDMVVAINVSDDKEEIGIANVRLTISNRGRLVRFLTHIRCRGCWSQWLLFHKSSHEHEISLDKRRKDFMRECGIEKVY